MQDFGKIFVYIGIVLVIVGFIWQVGGKIFSLGRLPGDIVIERENVKFYFPIATSILISILLSVILWIFSKLKG